MKTRKYNRYRKYFNKGKTRGVQKRYNKRTNNKRTNNKRTNKYKRKNTIRIHRRNFNKTKRKKGGAIPVGALPVIAVGAVALLAAIGGPIIGTYLDEASHDKEAKQKELIGALAKSEGLSPKTYAPMMDSDFTMGMTDEERDEENNLRAKGLPEDDDNDLSPSPEGQNYINRKEIGNRARKQSEQMLEIGNRARKQSEEIIKNSPYREEGEDGVAKPILDDSLLQQSP